MAVPQAAAFLRAVDCAACHHVALVTPEVLLGFGLSPAKVLDPKARLRCRGAERKGRAVVSIKWARQEA
jgi:hypothetical protein